MKIIVVIKVLNYYIYQVIAVHSESLVSSVQNREENVKVTSMERWDVRGYVILLQNMIFLYDHVSDVLCSNYSVMIVYTCSVVMVLRVVNLTDINTDIVGNIMFAEIKVHKLTLCGLKKIVCVKEVD